MTEGLTQQFAENRPYSQGMGRKLTKPRGQHGAKLAVLRREAGLTQAELGEAIGEQQQTIAYWERNSRPARADAIPKLAKVLGVTIEDLLDDKKTPKARPQRRGPTGKLQKLFDEVARLPRGQQDKITEFVSALVNEYKRKAS